MTSNIGEGAIFTSQTKDYGENNPLTRITFKIEQNNLDIK